MTHFVLPPYDRRSLMRLLLLPVILCMLLLLVPASVHADGGAPNLAYVAGTSRGISVIDISQQKITNTISVPSLPHMVLLSVDARFLYVTLPQQNRVAIYAAKTGAQLCTADVTGQPTLLALDPGSNTLYVAGNKVANVTALDPTNCHVKLVIHTDGPVYGLAVAVVGSGISGSTGNQLWVAANTLSEYDDLKGQFITSVTIPGGPHYVSIPPGATIYVTTRAGSVDAIDLMTRHVITLTSGGNYGPMDFDETTGEVYVPDMQNNQLVVLSPVNVGYTVPHEPARVVHLGVAPQSVAITSDGQLGFVALSGGNVAMLDIPGRQLITTFSVGGSPQFIITGLYPPVIGTTPQQASTYGTIINIAAYILVIALFLIPIWLFTSYARNNRAKKKG